MVALRAELENRDGFVALFEAVDAVDNPGHVDEGVTPDSIPAAEIVFGGDAVDFVGDLNDEFIVDGG